MVCVLRWHNKKLADCSLASRRVAFVKEQEQSSERQKPKPKSRISQTGADTQSSTEHTAQHSIAQRQAGGQAAHKDQTLPPSNVPKAEATATLTPTKQLRKKTTENRKSEVSIKAHTGQNSFQPVPATGPV